MREQQLTSDKRLRLRLLFFFYITAVGVFSNWLAPTPFDVAPFLLGNMALSVITQRLGWRWGLAATLLVLLPVHSVAMQVLGGLQFFLVYLFFRRFQWRLRRSIGAIVLLSLPCLIWAAKPEVRDPILWVLNCVILLLAIISNEWGARLIIRVTDAMRGNSQPFEFLLANRLTVAMASPLSLAALLILQLYIESDIKNVSIQLQEYADDSANIVNSFIREYRDIISSHATAMPAGNLDQYQQTLNVLGTSYTGFITLLITDQNGQILTRYPKRTDVQSRSVADRDYFLVPAHTLQTYVSGVFQGRGFGNDIITAISAPIRNRQGQLAGVMEGSLDVSQLERLLSHVSQNPNDRLLLRDAAGRVIFSSIPDYQLLQDTQYNPKFSTDSNATSYTLAMNASRTDFLAAQPIDVPHWQINVLRSYRASSYWYAALTIAALGFCMAIMAASWLFAGRFSHLIAAPLDSLVRRFRVLNFDDPDTLQPVTITTPVAELQELSVDFNALMNRLTGVYGQLRMSLNLLDSLNQDLENRVAERTADLLAARDHAEHLAEVKTSFLANMSHELRTPLTAILGFSAEALRQSELSENTRDALQVIQRNSQFLLDIIGDILDASKLEFDKLELEEIAFSPVALVRDACKALRPHAASKQISLNFNPHFPLPRQVRGDPVRVKQVLFNLLSNSIKFTERGSVEVNLVCDPDGIEWTMQVVDTGIGMNPEQQQRLFQPFVQADESTTRRFGGTGLGLFICKQLINRMNGNLMLESQYGSGSRFTVSLPTGVATPEWLRDGDAVPEIETPTAKSIIVPAVTGRILVAEDVEDLRRLIVAMVARTGAEVVAVSNGLLARDAALASPFDLIFMDMHMPVLDGIEAVRELRAKQYRKPIIALTADVMTSDILRFEAAGCDRVLAKPINEASLLTTIAHFLPTAPTPSKSTVTAPKMDREEATLLPAKAEAHDARSDQIQRMLVELSKRFLARLPGDREFMLQCLTTQDREGLKQRLHQLKGAAGSFGFPDISDVASTAYQHVDEPNEILTPAVQQVLQVIEKALAAAAPDARLS